MKSLNKYLKGEELPLQLQKSKKFQNLLLNSVNFKKYLATILCKIKLKEKYESKLLPVSGN